jgi:predicted nucleic acid-binding protein
MADIERRYWDSSAFLASIKNEAGRADICENIINDARTGRCEIYTSMLTLTEVVKRRPKENPIDPATEATITAFFKNTFIKLVPVDFIIATRGRRLIWDFPWLAARDAIHIATALELKIAVLEHYDDDDIGRVADRVKKENLPGFPEIRHPYWVGQTEMNLPAGEQARGTESAPPGGTK